MHTLRTALLAGVGAGALALTSPAYAVLIDAKGTGINYALTETTLTPTKHEFTLVITGINDTTDSDGAGPDKIDTEGGRTGVNAIAFTPPTGYVTAAMVTPPSGFVLGGNGLNSTGCNTSNANFFCFDNTGIPPTPTTLLPNDSSLTFVFDVTTSGLFPTTYNPAFKIDWVGTQNNYDLVSLTIGINGGPSGDPPPPGDDPDPVPEPASLLLLGGSLVAMGAAVIRRRKRLNAAA